MELIEKLGQRQTKKWQRVPIMGIFYVLYVGKKLRNI